MMSRSHLILTIALVAPCSAALLPATAHGGGPGRSAALPLDFENHVIWDQRDPTRAEFLPQAELQPDRRLDYPVNETLEVYLRKSADRETDDFQQFQKLFATEPHKHCPFSSGTSTSSRSHVTDASLEEFFRERSLVLDGKVVDIVPGWFRDEVQTMIYVLVDDILWCRTPDSARSVSVAEVVSISVRTGIVNVGGTFLCNATDASLKLPSIGDRVLLVGYPQKGYHHYLGLGTFHRIIEDEVEPQPYEGLQRKAVSLDKVKASLEPGSSRCGL